MSSSASTEPRSRLAQPDDLDLEDFFDIDADETIVRNDDLEKIVPNTRKNYLLEVDRYWVNKPYAYVVIFKNIKDKGHQYYLVEPQLTEKQQKIRELLRDKIRQSLDYDSISPKAAKNERGKVIRNKTYELLDNYNLLTDELTGKTRSTDPVTEFIQTLSDKIYDRVENTNPSIQQRNEFEDRPVEKLERREAEKIIYYIIRDYIGYKRIDGIMRDVHVEDISLNGDESTVFVQHAEHEQLITNIHFQKEAADSFVRSLAQKAGKGISKRQPDVDAVLEDGSRAALFLGSEITDKGTSFSIRKFTKIPFTPIDLINWGTYSIDMMVYLWMCVEAGKSAIIAGGTSSGKTTTLNAISLFIPATKKTVSIEDTREINIPQRNWNPLKTREVHGDDGKGDIKEYQLLENSLRMNPDYVIFGEVRGEEGRDLFQNMNTGHTTYSTFHGKDSRSVRVRLTTEPINVDETSFSGLDLLLTQEEVSISGDTERRCNAITELGDYNPDTNRFDIESHFMWDSKHDEFDDDLTTENMQDIPGIIDNIRHENGWNMGELEDEINKRRVVLAYLISNEMDTYTDVAAVLQGYMHDKANILSKIAEGTLKKDVNMLKTMRNVDLNVPEAVEEETPRPSPTTELQQEARAILNDNQHVYDDVTSDVDLGNFSGVEERRLEGDMYKSDSRVITEEEMAEQEEDTDTAYGYNEDIERENTNTDEDETGDSEVMDAIKDELGEDMFNEDDTDEDGVWSDKDTDANTENNSGDDE